MIRPRVLPILLAAWLPGCASVPEPDWLTEARAREAEPEQVRELRSEDGRLHARVPARLDGEVAPTEDGYALTLEFGSPTPLQCFVFPDGLDFATALDTFSRSTFDVIGERYGGVERRRVEGVDAGVLDEHPYMSVDWLYRVPAPQGSLVGEVKHLVAGKGELAVYCQHNELGYTESFRRVVAALLEDLRVETGSDAEPYFTQFSTLAVRGMRIGLEQTTLTRDADGDTRVDVQTSMLMPVTADTLQVSDSFAVEFVREDGTLINQVHVENANGELVSHLELLPAEDGAWSVDGTFQTKPLSARIEPEHPPASWLAEALALRRALERDEPGGEITLARWVPQADPTRLVEEKLSIGTRVAKDRFAARLEVAGLEADLVADSAGTIASGSIGMGFGSLDIERVYVGGSF